MAATFAWKEYNGAGGTETTATNLNFGSIDQANITTPASYPVAAGENSYEKYVKADFSGTFTSISNLRFYLLSGTIGANDHIYFDGETTSYTQPVVTISVVATTDIPESEPGTANVSIGGSLSGELTSAGKSDYIVLQFNSDAADSAGQKGPFTYRIYYDEV
jgi:hypothetical protein